MCYKIKYSCISHIGNIRSINQDNFICNGCYMNNNDSEIQFQLKGEVTSKSPMLFGVFDGMGGEECGEIASYIAAKKASTLLLGKNSILDLAEYCKQANNEICEFAESNLVSAMGTTAAMLLFQKKRITLCNVGDSKIFRLSNGELEQISKDHVAISVFGKKPPLSQNLGIPPKEMLIEPYFSQGMCQNGDKYLICSDGLTDMVSIDKINEILNTDQTVDYAEALLNKAIESGGKDNVTIIMLEVWQIKNNIFKIFNRENGGKKL